MGSIQAKATKPDIEAMISRASATSADPTPMAYRSQHRRPTESTPTVNDTEGVDFLNDAGREDVEPLPQRWHSGTADAYDQHNLLDHPAIWKGLVEFLRPYTKGKTVADLGCADGRLSTLIEARECINVDPYPPPNPQRDIIKMDGVEYLESREDESLDVVVTCYSVHFMDRAKLEQQLRRVLRKGGTAIHVNVSAKSPFFGDEGFNSVFFSKGFESNGSCGEQRPTQILDVPRPVTFQQLSHFITNRTWSNLVIMEQQELDFLTSRIPVDLLKMTLALDVYIHEF